MSESPVSEPSPQRRTLIARRLLLSGTGLGAAALASGLSGRSEKRPPVTGGGWDAGLRGACASSSISDAGINAFANTGGNLLRVMCTAAPLRDLAPPYALNESAFAQLDRVIETCRNCALHVVLDPHSIPGTRSRYTTRPTDPLWRQQFYQDLIVELWRYIAHRYRSAADVIVGYDLVNEPAVPNVTANDGLGSWNALAQRVVEAIREEDDHQTLIIEPAVGPGPDGRWINRFQAMQYLAPPPDQQVIVSPHMYAPQTFTFQGLEGRATGYSYPGRIDGKFWDKEALARYMSPARSYQLRYNVPVYVGEFSAARWTGEDGIAYLHDCISLFEASNWSWTYTGWREFQGWDAEMNSERDDTRRYRMTPRLALLERCFRRN